MRYDLKDILSATWIIGGFPNQSCVIKIPKDTYSAIELGFLFWAAKNRCIGDLNFFQSTQHSEVNAKEDVLLMDKKTLGLFKVFVKRIIEPGADPSTYTHIWTPPW